MYYEEQVVNGVLCYRTSPRGCWNRVSAETLTTRLVKAQADLVRAAAQRRVDPEQLRIESDRWHTPSDFC
jgi:hypothetical protein